jgi:predicted TIM-barrel fold metal-dependent hydrolase
MNEEGAGQAGASQVMPGTDHPIPWKQHPVDQVFATTLSDKERLAILGGNAARLLRLKET